MSKEELEKERFLYEGLLNKLKAYLNLCKEGQQIPSDKEFFLYFLWGKLCNRLHQYKESVEKHQKAKALLMVAMQSKKGKDEWVKKIDVNLLIGGILDPRLQKHQLKAIGPLYHGSERPTNIEEVLASKTYVEKSSSKKVNFNAILKLLNSVEVPSFVRTVLLLNSLDALEHRQFAIFFKNDINYGEELSCFDRKNKVMIQLIEDNRKDLNLYYAECLFHELMHKALDRIFINGSLPYFAIDKIAKEAYKQCIQEVLLNVVYAILSPNILKKLKKNIEYKIITNLPRYEYSHDAMPSIMELSKIDSHLKPTKKNLFNIECRSCCFPNTWENMTFNNLLENCFEKGGLFYGKLSEHNWLILENEEKIHFSLSPYVKHLYNQMIIIFNVGGIGYPLQLLHIEFIASLYDSCIRPEAQNNAIMKPLVDYIQKFIMPEMDKYIGDHPSKNKINEKLVII